MTRGVKQQSPEPGCPRGLLPKMFKHLYTKADNLWKTHPAVVNVFLFAVITYGFHVIWKIFQQTIESAEWYILLGEWFATRAYIIAVWINLNILGLDMTTNDPNLMRFAGSGSILIDQTCSGLKQFYQVIVLFVLFPGPWRHKLWFIPAALLVMHWTNIFRVVGLSVVMAYIPQHWDFVHDWVLRPFFYVVLFALWVIWVERVSGLYKREA